MILNERERQQSCFLGLCFVSAHSMRHIECSGGKRVEEDCDDWTETTGCRGGSQSVLILTARELFGQFRLGEFSELYSTDAQMARNLFMHGDINELCEFTQKLYLGTPSSHEVRRQKMQKLALKSKRA